MKARERLIALLDTSCGYKDDSKSQRDTYAAIRLIDALLNDMAAFAENTAYIPTGYALYDRAIKLGYDGKKILSGFSPPASSGSQGSG